MSRTAAPYVVGQTIWPSTRCCRSGRLVLTRADRALAERRAALRNLEAVVHLMKCEAMRPCHRSTAPRRRPSMRSHAEGRRAAAVRGLTAWGRDRARGTPRAHRPVRAAARSLPHTRRAAPSSPRRTPNVLGHEELPPRKTRVRVPTEERPGFVGQLAIDSASQRLKRAPRRNSTCPIQTTPTVSATGCPARRGSRP